LPSTGDRVLPNGSSYDQTHLMVDYPQPNGTVHHAHDNGEVKRSNSKVRRSHGLTASSMDSMGEQPALSPTSLEEEEWKQEVDVTYRVDEAPAFAVCVLLGFQACISVT